MSLPPPAMTQPVIRLAHTWSVTLQQRARRNAMVALTACTQRRAEREDVEAFLAARAAARRTPVPETSVSLHA